ncbi:MAG: peptidoglycan binding domain-containing protein [Chloroflexota bacterium]|nr:peptidoglycan binding domain-containing protein [Chloroflexota bacterium]
MGSVAGRYPRRLALAGGQVEARRTNTVQDRLARVLQLAVMMTGAVLLAGIAGLGLYANAHAERVFEGVDVAGVPVGGMTKAEAIAAVQDRFDAYAGQKITLIAGEQAFSLTPQDAGARLDEPATLDAVFAVGRTGSWWFRSQEWVRAIVDGVSVEPRVVVDEARLDGHLIALAPDVIRPPQDAHVSMDVVGQPTLVDDSPGVGLDVTSSRARISTHFQRLDPDSVPLVTPPLAAAIRSESLIDSLPHARAAVAKDLLLMTKEGSWTVARADLKRVVRVNPGDGRIVVDRPPLQNLVEGIAAGIDHASVDAGITVSAEGALVVVPGTDAAEVNVEITVDGIVQALSEGNHEVEITVARRAPAIVDSEAAAAVLDGEALVRRGMDLTWRGGDAQLGRGDLISALIVKTRPGDDRPFRFDLDPAVLNVVLSSVQEEIDRPAVDARFRLIDGVVTLDSDAEEGRALDLNKAVDDVREAVLEGKASVMLPIDPVEPRFTATDRSQIRLPDVLADASTSYANSSDPRRQNVERAASLEDGWLVPPGGVFSYVENVGRIDDTNGFVTGFGIVAEEGGGVTTAPVVGGGICQVSTTIFQAAFWAGMPIVERYQHPYWLTSYGVAPRGMKGLDAMVNVEDDWALDMKFQNGTEDWIAVVLTADGQDITAKILGTDPGWTVRVDGPRITNVLPLDPSMHYTKSSELPKGEELLVETAQEGFDSSITRTVTQGGERIDTYTLTSSFLPSRNTTLRGTG